MKPLFKVIACRLLGDYAIYQVWRTDRPSEHGAVERLTVRRARVSDLDLACTDPAIREAAWYFGDESAAFGCFDSDRLVGLACYWHGSRYASRNSWPIEGKAAKLVHIVTAASERGRGIATYLIVRSSAILLQDGFRPLYARIWHSNGPSRAAFARAGWQPCGWLLQVNPLRREQPWALRLRTRAERR